MKLESVELIGFKSFARKTRIEFPAGLTEIVGPNGSGKSNVIEAIRWALGEQSARRLRSSKMSDVIFSGSKGHPALNRAKVTLTFDNRDHWLKSNYSELRVARKIYRNGDSYYYLNGRECRLRDIQNLFMNSGIGAGSFSIISQGQVEQIFQSKPEDRRFIIETAAGIYRYKAQKQAARQELKATDNNVTRIEDLVGELKHQLLQLGQQRRQAQRYLIGKHQGERLTTQLLILSRHSLQKRATRLGRQLQDRYHRAAKINGQINGLQKQRRGCQATIEALRSRRNQLQNRLVKAVQQADRFDNQRKLAFQKLTFQKRTRKFTRSQLHRFNGSNRQLMTTISRLLPEIEGSRHQVSRLRLVVKKSSGSVQQQAIHKNQQRIKKLREQYVRELQESARVVNQIHTYYHDQQAFKVRVQELKQRLKQVSDLIRERQNQRRKLIQASHRLNRRGDQLADQIKAHNQLIQKWRFQLRQRMKNYHQQTQHARSLQAQRNALEKLTTSHANLHHGSRNLLKLMGRNQGVLGPVAKFIRVPGHYVKAIEATLRSQLQQIIVTTPQVARKAVAVLNTRRLGRVTFLPLKAISKHWVSRRLIQQSRVLPGLIGVAADLVRMPEPMQRIKSHLLGNVLVARNLRSAIQISRNLRRRYRVVTLNGDLVNAGGSITGGRGRYAYHGLLLQRYQLHQISKQLHNDRTRLVVSQSKIVKERHRFHRLGNQLLQWQRRLSQFRQWLNTQSRLEQQLASEIHQQGRERQAVQLSLTNFRCRHSGMSLVQLKRVQQHLQKRINQNASAIRRLTVGVEHCQRRLGIQRRAGQSRREKLIRQTGRLASLKRRLMTSRRKLSQNRHSVKQLTDQLTHSQRLIREFQRRLRPVHSRLDRGAINQIELRQRSYQQRLQRQRLNLRKRAQRIFSLQDQLVSERTSLAQLKLRHRKLIHQLGLVTDRLRIRPVHSQPRSLSQTSLLGIKRQLKRVKRQIKQLGIINLKSIAEFSRVHRRYSFLSRQLMDLIHSQNQLSRAMSRMNTTIKIRFKNTFERIDRSFRTTYTEIFKGGRAKLKLTDPKHLLTTGINIMAQPPGKRYRSMELLSGGERALTAIALLFAVIRIKPVPFCILDEAESSLDLINVGRFARYINKLKHRTQFIVITHRKETMLYADNLYGITMQQSGISTVISVNLNRIKSGR